MKEKKIVTLDLTDCKYLGEIHQRIKKAFHFPDFYGENWSAFWDQILKGILKEFKELCDKDGDPIEIEIHG